jgi:hypothetical protein
MSGIVIKHEGINASEINTTQFIVSHPFFAKHLPRFATLSDIVPVAERFCYGETRITLTREHWKGRVRTVGRVGRDQIIAFYDPSDASATDSTFYVAALRDLHDAGLEQIWDLVMEKTNEEYRVLPMAVITNSAGKISIQLLQMQIRRVKTKYRVTQRIDLVHDGRAVLLEKVPHFAQQVSKAFIRSITL